MKAVMLSFGGLSDRLEDCITFAKGFEGTLVGTPKALAVLLGGNGNENVCCCVPKGCDGCGVGLGANAKAGGFEVSGCENPANAF